MRCLTVYVEENKFFISAITLFLFLFLPFLFRSSIVKIELFPAIIMPSGSKKVNVESEYLRFDDLNLYGIDSLGNEKKLNHTDFLDPVPVWYLSSLVKRGFGVNPNIKPKPKMFKSNAIHTEEDIEEGRQFLRMHLKEQDCSDSLLIVKREVAYFNLETRVIDSVTIENTTLYVLY